MSTLSLSPSLCAQVDSILSIPAAAVPVPGQWSNHFPSTKLPRSGPSSRHPNHIQTISCANKTKIGSMKTTRKATTHRLASVPTKKFKPATPTVATQTPKHNRRPHRRPRSRQMSLQFQLLAARQCHHRIRSRPLTNRLPAESHNLNQRRLPRCHRRRSPQRFESIFWLACFNWLTKLLFFVFVLFQVTTSIVTKMMPQQVAPALSQMKANKFEMQKLPLQQQLSNEQRSDDESQSPSPPSLGFQRHNSLTRKQAAQLAAQRAKAMQSSARAVSLAQLPPPIEVDSDDADTVVGGHKAGTTLPADQIVLAPPPEFCDFVSSANSNQRVRIIGTIPKANRLHSQ